MRAAYPAVFLCALACASVPSNSRLSSTGADAAPTVLASSAGNVSSRGYLLTGSFPTEYFGGETLYDVLRRRAPLYLRPRGTPAQDFVGHADEISVYLNGNFSGGLDALQSIPAHEVFSVERVNAVDAMIRFGPKHNNGALLVTLIRH